MAGVLVHFGLVHTRQPKGVPEGMRIVDFAHMD